MTDILLPGWRRCAHCGTAYVPTGLRQRYCWLPTCQRARRAKYTQAYRQRRRDRIRANLADVTAIIANS